MQENKGRRRKKSSLDSLQHLEKPLYECEMNKAGQTLFSNISKNINNYSALFTTVERLTNPRIAFDFLQPTFISVMSLHLFFFCGNTFHIKQ